MKYLGHVGDRFNVFELSTGRRFQANIGAIGITPELGRVTEGYDGSLHGVTDDDWIDPDTPEDAWTPAERAELADYMIDLWRQWKRKHETTYA